MIQDHFHKRLDIIELEVLDIKKLVKKENKIIDKNKKLSINDILLNYSKSKDFGKPFTYTEESYDKFLLTTIKNVTDGKKNVGFLAIIENANDIRVAINERKSFVIRTAVILVIVILIFSFVLNKYFLKPIKNLVIYTKIN